MVAMDAGAAPAPPVGSAHVSSSSSAVRAWGAEKAGFVLLLRHRPSTGRLHPALAPPAPSSSSSAVGAWGAEKAGSVLLLRHRPSTREARPHTRHRRRSSSARSHLCQAEGLGTGRQ